MGCAGPVAGLRTWPTLPLTTLRSCSLVGGHTPIRCSDFNIAIAMPIAVGAAAPSPLGCANGT